MSVRECQGCCRKARNASSCSQMSVVLARNGRYWPDFPKCTVCQLLQFDHNWLFHQIFLGKGNAHQWGIPCDHYLQCVRSEKAVSWMCCNYKLIMKSSLHIFYHQGCEKWSNRLCNCVERHPVASPLWLIIIYQALYICLLWGLINYSGGATDPFHPIFTGPLYGHKG